MESTNYFFMCSKQLHMTLYLFESKYKHNGIRGEISECQVQAEETACQLNSACSTASLENTQLDLCRDFPVVG